MIVRRERVLRCGDDDSKGFALGTTSGILGNAGETPTEWSRQRPAASSRGKGADRSNTLRQD